mgnify:CR=1 FL=1
MYLWNFDFGTKFQFLEEISIFEQIFGQNFQFLDFGPKLRCD